MSKPRATTYTVSGDADKKSTCSRCRFPLRAGERATILRYPESVEIRHAGRKCPPTGPRVGAPTRYVRNTA